MKVENIRNGRINVSSIRDYISREANLNQARSILQEGDILLSIAGTIGVTCFVCKDDLPANTNQALAIIRGTSAVLEPLFLRYQLESDVAMSQYRQKERGGGMNNISLEDVRNFDISIAPINQQIRIVKKLDKLMHILDSIKERFDGTPDFYKRLRLSILAKAFRGELVPQDPNDEPASVLLERIRKERAKQKPDKKIVKRRRQNG